MIPPPPPEPSCLDQSPHHINDQPSPDRDKLLVFIHGWGGSERETWGCFLNIVRNDRRLIDFQVMSYNYPTSLFGHSPSIEDISLNLEQTLLNCCSHIKRYVFVAHSMGGIVAKEYVLNLLRRGRAADMKVEVMFLIGTPNSGADIARWASYVPVISSAQIKSLRGVDDPFLRTQLKDWDRHVWMSDWRIHESQKKFVKAIVIFGTADEVVSKDSATDRFPFSISAFNDHTGLVKPLKSDDYVVQTVICWTVSTMSGGTVENQCESENTKLIRSH